MLTLFAIPKAFRGHTGAIQRNAVGSWARLGRDARVILFGGEAGMAEVARESHVEYVPEVARNEFGTPLVSALFHEARKLSAHEVLCYVNSDVILYSHVHGGREWSYNGPEAVRNVQLAGGPEHLYRIDHASHVLTSWGLRRQWPSWQSRRGGRLEYHLDGWLGRVTWLAHEATRRVRHRLGLRAATFPQIRSLVARWRGKV